MPRLQLAVFDSDDRARFFAEMRAALDAGEAASDAEPMETCLRAWRVTAQALSRPAIREALTRAGDDDYEEVTRP